MAIRHIVTRGFIAALTLPGVETIVGNVSSVVAVNSTFVIPVACNNAFNLELDEDIDDVFLGEDEFTDLAYYTDVGSNKFTLYGIFDDPYALSQPETEIGLQSIGPTFKCKLSDITDTSGSVRAGDTILICERLYRVQESQPDGVGLTILTLKNP